MSSRFRNTPTNAFVEDFKSAMRQGSDLEKRIAIISLPMETTTRRAFQVDEQLAQVAVSTGHSLATRLDAVNNIYLPNALLTVIAHSQDEEVKGQATRQLAVHLD